MRKENQKELNYKIGALKRKYEVSSDAPGALLEKYNQSKFQKPTPKKVKNVAIKGLV